MVPLQRGTFVPFASTVPFFLKTLDGVRMINADLGQLPATAASTLRYSLPRRMF